MSPPVFYDGATTWKEEYKRRPGERVVLRDGTVLKPNQRFEGPAYCASKGKKQAKNVATVSFYMLSQASTARWGARGPRPQTPT